MLDIYLSHRYEALDIALIHSLLILSLVLPPHDTCNDRTSTLLNPTHRTVLMRRIKVSLSLPCFKIRVGPFVPTVPRFWADCFVCMLLLLFLSILAMAVAQQRTAAAALKCAVLCCARQLQRSLLSNQRHYPYSLFLVPTLSQQHCPPDDMGQRKWALIPRRERPRRERKDKGGLLLSSPPSTLPPRFYPIAKAHLNAARSAKRATHAQLRHLLKKA